MSEAATNAPSEGLQWVRKELATTIVDARTHLEKFSEHQDDRTPLTAVAELLHLAHGALRMVEVYGAALLVEEMMMVAKRLQSDTFDGADDALEALSRAIVQLPAYLDRVAGGGNDVPLVLLPLLNDLRAVRGSPLLSESSLFVLNVDQGSATPQRVVPPASLDYKILARKIRPHYQRSLLGWLRGENVAKNLHVLSEAALKLEEGAATTRVFQFWWVLGGVIEAIRHQGLRPSAAVKRLLGQADQQLKMLSQSGEEVFEQTPPSSLLNSLLYYVARAESKTKKVMAIKSSFSLTDMLQPGEPKEPGESEDLTLLQAPSVNLMKTVGAAIKQDMSNVKDSIDIFVRTKSDQHQDLLPQAESLQKLSDTLGVVGLDALRQQIAGEATRLKQFVDASSNDDEALLQIAATLINVEAAIDEQLLGVIIPEARHASAVSLSAAEMAADVERKQVVAAVLRECIVNLTRIKETLSQFIEQPDRGAVLDGIPNLIKGICAGLSILEKTRAVEVLLQVEWHINTITGDKDFGSHTHELDRLADAIVSVEYYMDTIRNGRVDPWYMLENAETCLKSIKRQPPEDKTVPESGEQQAVSDSGFSQPVEPDVATTDELAAEQTAHEPEAFVAARDEDHIEATGVRAAVTAAAASARKLERTGRMPALDHPLSAINGKRVDPELLELFIEEAKEEMASLRRSLPRWQHNVEDREVLLTIRRSFHTLKGSGRMVGANLIGEYAWGLENLTNKVVSQSLPADERVTRILSDGVDKLPQLIEQLEIGTPPEPELVELIDSAWALADEPFAAAETRREGDDSTVADQVEADVTASDAAQEPIDDDSIDASAMDNAQDDIDVEQTAITRVLTERVSINDVTPTEDNLGLSDSSGSTGIYQSLDIPLEQGGEIGSGEDTAQLRALEPADMGKTTDDDEPGQIESADTTDTASIDASTTGVVPGVVLEMQPLDPEPSDADDHPRPTEPAIVLDKALHQIFLKESLEHLETINLFIEEVSGQVEPFAVTEPLHRAWHTLSGSANTANITAAAAIATPINHHLRNLLAEGQPLSAKAVNILKRASGALEEIVRGINQQLILPNVDQLLRDVDTLPELGADAIERLNKLEGTGEIEIPTLSALKGPGYDLEIAAIFAEEAVEILESSDVALTEWIAQSEVHTPQMEDLLRHLHTIKGGARMAGIVAMGDLSHETESLIERVRDKQQAFDTDCKNVLQQCVDQLHSMTDDLQHSRAVPGADALLQRIAQLGGAAVPAEIETNVHSAEAEDALAVASDDSIAQRTKEVEPPLHETIVPSLESAAEVDAVVDQLDAAVSEFESSVLQSTPAATADGEDKPQDMARIDARVLDEMLNNAGEVSIFHSRLEEQVGSISFNLTELHQTVARLREQLRKLEIETEAQILHKYNDEKTRHEEFDPLELDRYSGLHQLSRALAESVSDLVSLQHLMTDITRESEALLVQQARVTGELQDALIRSRMLPFERYVPRFERIVRQAANEQNKRAVLTVTGGSGELDRQVLQRMLPPFEHMLRNAVIHGIESADEREAAGKPEAGQIVIDLVREGAEMVIRVSDDGRGLDAQKIIRKAQEQGLLESHQHIADAKAYELILSHGFSTAGAVTQSAGRGVGMDVVANQVKTLGGSLQLESQQDQGTQIVIRLPLTLAVSQALLVRCADERFAIPLPAVEGIVRVPLDEIKSAFENPQHVFENDGNSYTIRHLSPYLGGPRVNLDDIETPSMPVILIRAGEHSSALLVDELMGSREVVVKSAGPMVSRITGVAGATILGDGSIVVILDVAALIRNETDQRDEKNYVVAQSNEDLRPVVLVVDDSITVRRVTQRLLERNNMKVLLAKDGVDAVAVMQEQIPDLVLLDIEMPRMDGYEVASHIRNSPELEHVPITMITSRVGEKHRARAFELGVDKYLGKPYQENQLLDVIQPLLARSIKQRK